MESFGESKTYFGAVRSESLFGFFIVFTKMPAGPLRWKPFHTGTLTGPLGSTRKAYAPKVQPTPQLG